jgi:hypothetical protein
MPRRKSGIGERSPDIRLERNGRRGNGTYFNDAVLLRGRIERVLNVALAHDAQMPDDIDRGRAQHVVVLVRERLRRCHYDRIACMYTERIEVLSI